MDELTSHQAVNILYEFTKVARLTLEEHKVAAAAFTVLLKRLEEKENVEKSVRSESNRNDPVS